MIFNENHSNAEIKNGFIFLNFHSFTIKMKNQFII
jgi:hypothetical protein